MKKLTISILAFLFAFGTLFAAEPPAEDTAKTGKAIHLTKTEFLEKVYNYKQHPKEWKYEGDKPAIVDFYATWCGPCKVVSPILDKLAKEYGEDIYVYKIDVDKEPELAGTFGINSIPTFLFIPMEGNPQVGQGALPEKSFRKVIKEFLLPQK